MTRTSSAGLIRGFGWIAVALMCVVVPQHTLGAITWLPEGPRVSDLDGTAFQQHSSSNFTVSYVLPTEYDWDGVMVHWDDWGPHDLSAITQFTFAVRGLPNRIKVEFEATNSTKSVVVLADVSNDVWQTYNIPASLITNDLHKMKVISFVTDYGLAGAGKYTGTYSVVVQGLAFDWRVNGQPSGSPTHMPNLPDVYAVGGANPFTVLVNTNAAQIDVSYNVTSGWSGAAIVYNDYGTVSNESQNLLAYSQLVFGVRGDCRNVKVEFLDASNAVMIGYCTNVGATTKYYAFELGLLTNRISAISAINFVVDSNLCGQASLGGNLHIESAGLDYAVELGGDLAGTPTILPGEPPVEAVGGANEHTVVTLLSPSDIQVQYVVTSGWAGASILYDDFATAPVETGDLSAYGALVFGVTGRPARVKCEVQDNAGHKALATFTNTGSTLRYFSLGAAHLTNKLVNLSAVSVISFVVDTATAGAGNETGTVVIKSGGLDYPLEVGGEPSGALTTLPPTPLDVTPVGGANGDTRVDQFSSQRFRVTYNAPTGWAGASILYDDFGSGPVETGSFAALTSVVFAVKGDAARVQAEFEDASSNKVGVTLLGVSDALQYYPISVSALSNKGLKVQSVRSIGFVVDASLAGAADLSGRFEVFTAGLTYQNLVYENMDEDGDDLPDSWEEKYGLSTGDDGSGNPDNGPHGDPDHDGVDNLTERIAGTHPRVFSSEPALDIAGNRTNVTITMGGVGQREYRFYRTDHLVTGQWARVGPVYRFGTNGTVQLTESTLTQTDGFYTCQIRMSDVSRLVGLPQVTEIGGGESNTVIQQSSSSELIVNYNVTQGWAGVTFLYDDFGTPEIESKSFAGYSELTFAISGMPQGVKYEFEDASSNKVSGWFRYVTNRWTYYTIDTALLADGGLDLAHLRFFSFLVDSNTAGAANLIGSFGVRTWGAAYTIETWGQTVGSVTTLRTKPPAVDNVGGGQSTNAWIQTGTTNIAVSYDITPADTWDGVTIRYDDYGTPALENSDYSEVPALTFGVKGTPQNLKLEVEDTSSHKVSAYLRGVTNTLKYFTVDMGDVEGGGVDVGHVRALNFVVDQGLASNGNYVGTFTIVTDGLAP